MTVKIIGARAIPVAQLRSHPGNVRDDLGDIQELARSMRSQGVLQPLLVAPRTVRGEEVFVVLDGHRRLAAARQGQIGALPCLITAEGTRDETLATMLAAAMHKGLGPLEQAEAFKALQNQGMTISQIAAQTGYHPNTVRDRLRLRELPREARDMLAEREITVGHATQLARQVSKNGKGATTTTAAPKQSWFGKTHRLANRARSICSEDHRATRVLVGGLACGQCWEQVITRDAARRPA